MFLHSTDAPGESDRQALACLREATGETDRLIIDCMDAGVFVTKASPTAVRRALWAAIHGAAVIRLRRRLPADADPDQLAADTLDAALAGLSRRR